MERNTKKLRESPQGVRHVLYSSQNQRKEKRSRIKGARGKKFSYANVFLTVIKASFIEEAIIEPPFDPPPRSSLHKQLRLGTFSESYNDEAT